MSEEANGNAEPRWLTVLRSDAVQRPRTQFRNVRWAHLQPLLRDYDTLIADASAKTLARISTAREHDVVRYKN
jgi:hypothetical protein